jgi:ABC-type multidrug transport system ATPase subunit
MIEVESVSIARGELTYVDRLSFSVTAGEAYCFLGGAGSGKEAAISLVMGFSRPTDGSVRVLGANPYTQRLSVASRISFFGGAGSLYPSLTPLENFCLFVRVADQQRKVTATEAKNALRSAEVPERFFAVKLAHLERAVTVYVALAIATYLGRPIAVLENPSRGLDSLASNRLAGMLQRLRSAGTVVLLATNDLHLAVAVADRIAILKDGRKVAERSRAELLGASYIEVFADYLGTSGATNAVPARKGSDT